MDQLDRLYGMPMVVLSTGADWAKDAGLYQFLTTRSGTGIAVILRAFEAEHSDRRLKVVPFAVVADHEPTSLLDILLCMPEIRYPPGLVVDPRVG